MEDSFEAPPTPTDGFQDLGRVGRDDRRAKRVEWPSNLAELAVDGPAGHIEALSLRLDNVQTGQWSLNFSSISSFEPELTALEGVVVLRDPMKAKAVHFALVFAAKLAEVDAWSRILADKAEGDALLWLAYPSLLAMR